VLFTKANGYHGIITIKVECADTDIQEMKRIFTSSEGVRLTFIFTLIFIVTNLIMVDFRGVQNLMTGYNQTAFFILILIMILAYLYKIERFNT